MLDTLWVRRLGGGLVGKVLLRIHRLFNSKLTGSFWGHRFNYDPGTDIGQTLYLTGSFEESELDLCAKYIPSDAVVLDIGANIGLHSVYFSQKVPRGFVLAFEPSLETFQLLATNVVGIENVSLLNVAISNQGGILDFFVASDNAYSGLMDTKRKSIRDVIKVPCMRVDDVLKNININRVDFVKIDVEGLELNVLQGMTQAIETYKPVIFCEIYAGRNSNSDPDGTVKFVCAAGYSAYTMRNGQLLPYKKHDDNFYNYLFLPTGNGDRILG